MIMKNRYQQLRQDIQQLEVICKRDEQIFLVQNALKLFSLSTVLIAGLLHYL